MLLVLDACKHGRAGANRYSRHVREWSTEEVRGFVKNFADGAQEPGTFGLSCAELLGLPLAIEPFKEISPSSCTFWEQRYKDRRCRGFLAACFTPTQARQDVLAYTALFDTMAHEFPELLYMWTAARRPRSPTCASEAHAILVLDAATPGRVGGRGFRLQGLRFPFAGPEWTSAAMRQFIAGALSGSVGPEMVGSSCSELLACWLDGLFSP